MKRIIVSILCIFSLTNNLGAYIARIAQISATTSHCVSTKTFSSHIHHHIQNTIERFNIRPDVLEKSDCYFSEIPGYQKLLDCIKEGYKQPHFCKGFLFELEAALALCEQSDDAITWFHYSMHRPNSSIPSDSREIDVMSNHHITECKYYAWKYANLPNLKKQLGHQHSILKDHNRYYGTNYTHLLYSKNKIPNTVTQWLTDHNIQYREYSKSINADTQLDGDI